MTHSFNPNNKPLSSLPIIYGYDAGDQVALVITADGRPLGGTAGIKDDDSMRCVLGITEDATERRTLRVSDEEIEARMGWYKEHYPNGYRTEFITASDTASHRGLVNAIRASKVKS